jgi:hypothetical protein
MIRAARHLVAHDCRRFWLPIVMFAAAVIGEAVLVVWWPAGPTPIRRSFVLVPWGSILRTLLGGIVAALCVQSDSLVGTSAFWRTRPISRSTMLLSKTLTVTGLLVVLPGLVAGLVWHVIGLAPADCLAVAGSVMLEQAMVVLLAAMAASVTPNFTYLVIAGVAGVTMVSLFNSVALPMLVTTWPMVGTTLTGFRPAVYLGVLFAIGIPAVVNQFITMREWRTAILVALALFGSTAAARLWPPEPRALDAAPDLRTFNPSEVTLAVTPGTQQRWEIRDRRAGRDNHEAHYGAELTARGPSGAVLWLKQVDARLLLSDRTVGSVLEVIGTPIRADQPRGSDPAMPSLARAFAPAALLPSSGPSKQLPHAALVSVPASIDRGHAGERAVLTANVGMTATRYTIAGVVPARAGELLRIPGTAARITAVSVTGRQVLIRLDAGVVAPSGVDFRLYQGALGCTFALRNPKRGEAVLARTETFRRQLMATIGVSTLSATRFNAILSFGPRGNGTAGSIDAAWLADAELVALTIEPLGSFTRPLQMEIEVGKGR